MGQILLPKQYHPDFAQPGKKPIGPVIIDWSNSLSHGLSFFSLLTGSGNGVLNLVSGKNYQDATDFWGASGADPWTIGHTLSGTTRNRDVSSAASMVRALPSGGMDNTQAKTVLGKFRYASGSVDQALIHFGNTVAVQKPLMWADTVGGNLRPAFFSGSSVFGASASIPVGRDVIWGGGYLPSTNPSVTFYVDGLQSGTANQDGGSTSAVTNEFMFIGADGADSRDVIGGIYFIAVWDRRLSPAEHLAFNANPYQILKPATAQIYTFPSGAAPPTTIPVIMNHLRNQGIS